MPGVIIHPIVRLRIDTLAFRTLPHLVAAQLDLKKSELTFTRKTTNSKIILSCFRYLQIRMKPPETAFTCDDMSGGWLSISSQVNRYREQHTYPFALSSLPITSLLAERK